MTLILALACLTLSAPHIVLDAGHGGRHEGARGVCAIWEKDVTLDIAQYLETILRREYKMHVTMTRTKDETLSLEKRIQIANQADAELFLSIHANSSTNADHQGFETFFASAEGTSAATPLDVHARQVALRENGEEKRDEIFTSNIDSILASLERNQAHAQSQALAFDIRRALGRRGKLRGRGVLQAPFFVLTRTRIPAVLVEVGFLTNPAECGRLIDHDYQKQLAHDLAGGLISFLRHQPPIRPERTPRKGFKET